MTPHSRLFWMKLHAYLACFFLPFTLIYVATGVLHLFDYHGDITQQYEYQIELPTGWPQDEAAATQIVKPFVTELGHAFSEQYYTEPGMHDWYDRRQEIILTPVEGSEQTIGHLVIKEHDLWMQLLFIHKGIAGEVFWIIGVFFGLHLLLSMISGVTLSLQSPGLKSLSLLSLLAGTVLLLILLVI